MISCGISTNVRQLAFAPFAPSVFPLLFEKFREKKFAIVLKKRKKLKDQKNGDILIQKEKVGLHLPMNSP